MKTQTIEDRDEMKLIERVMEIRKNNKVSNVKLDRFDAETGYGNYKAIVTFEDEN